MYEGQLLASFKFMLLSILRINMTFHNIYMFSPGTIQYQSYLVIHNTYLRENCLINPSFCDIVGRIFQGHNSTFNFYPELYNMKIDIVWYNIRDHMINVSFQIMDQNIIDNFINTSRYAFNINLMYRIQSKSKELLEVFYVQVRKTNQILFNFHEHLLQKYVVFDGPGFLSKRLHKSNVSGWMLKTSSFQCIVQVLSKYLEKWVRNYFNYTSEALKKYKHLNVHHMKNSVNVLPNEKYWHSPIIIEIYAKIRYQVNIRVMNLSSNIDVFPYCTFGELQIVEQFSWEFRNAIPLCNSYSKSRTVYSYNSSVMILLY